MHRACTPQAYVLATEKRAAAVGNIAFYILSSGSGWRVVSRSFAWDFRSREEATAFALACSRNYAEAAGVATTVRVQDGSGGFQELFGHPGRAHRVRSTPDTG